MKKSIIAILIMLFAVSVMGCNQTVDEDPSKDDEPGIIGYVMNRENERILVIDPEAQDFSPTGGVSEYYDAIWFSNVPQDIELGEKVKVWFDIVEDSYPAQSDAIQIEVIPSQRPAEADLTEADALYEALTSELSHNDGLIVVKNIEYDNETDTWDFTFKEIWGDEIYSIQIDDK
ncbi:MAG: hypothetical protein APF76_01975 [Desulfitibacter sp. BRH_c19]|nr:MAG: hypothetical protein APF76_01975 [Desulfitibacter sp. BRH_c19]